MKSKEGKDLGQGKFLLPGLKDQLDPRQPIRKLADALPWEEFEKAFAAYYAGIGRPAKPVRLMVGLLLLKQMFGLGDETVVAAWVQNPYWQYFCGMEEFCWEVPCDPSDLVKFRNRIGEEGMKLILAVSAAMHGDKALESQVVVDSTVQEKKAMFPTDSKLYRKVIQRCWRLADAEGVQLRRRYGKEVRQCVMAQRWTRDREKIKQARKGQRRLRTIAGILIRELERKLAPGKAEEQKENFALFRRVLRQKRADRHKVYSLHEPHIYCVAKGKEHKKYEFGTKASIAITKTHGVIVAAVAHEKNLYDGDSLPEVLDEVQAHTNHRPKLAIVDRGYRGRAQVGGTQVLLPGKKKPGQSKSLTTKLRKYFRRRAAIEPVIGHLKHQYGLACCFLKGFIGDQVNLLLASAAWNFKKWMNNLLFYFQLLFESCLAQNTCRI